MATEVHPNTAVIERRSAVELLCHLAASAELGVTEPVYYATFRLLDATSRVCEALLRGGLDDPVLDEVRREIEGKKGLMMSDRDTYFAFLPEVSIKLAAHLRALVAGEPGLPSAEEAGRPSH